MIIIDMNRCAVLALTAAILLGGCRARSMEVVREIESWDAPQSVVEWKAWDGSVTIMQDSTAVHASSSLKLVYDFAKYQWPLAFREFFTPVRLDDATHVAVEVFVPGDAAPGVDFMIAFVGSAKHASGRVSLKTGWQTVRVELAESWLAGPARSAAARIELILTSNSSGAAGSVLFDRLRLER